MMPLRYLLFLIMMLLPTQLLHAFGQQAEYSSIELFADKTSVQGGDTVTIAVKQHLHEGWHTYWKNPGDSGEGIAINWQLPEGTKLEEMRWPTPKRIDYEGLVSYGYENEATTLQTLTFPDSIPADEFTITADIMLLVCEKICIPESHKVSLTFNGQTIANPDAIKKAIAQLPKEQPTVISYKEHYDTLWIEASDILKNINPESKSVIIYGEQLGLMSNTHPAKVIYETNSLYFVSDIGDLQPQSVASSHFVIAYDDQEGNPQAIRVIGHYKADLTIPETVITQENKGRSSPNSSTTEKESISLTQALLFALLGGIILNLMPCVFPVLSLKILSLIRMNDEELSHARKHGLMYTLGILLSFACIVVILLSLKGAGEEIGWGFHLQNPIVIIVITYIIFLIGLNLLGMFEIGGRMAGVGQKLTQGNSLKSSFFTGMLATIVATPCTAPFMGVALGYGITQPAVISMGIFMALGFGLALPYLLLCYVPALAKFLPKPGAWMNSLKEFLAFPMFATCIWLTWVLHQQTGGDNIFIVIVGLLLLTFGIWWIQHSQSKWILRMVGWLLVLFSLMTPFLITSESNTTISYTPESLKQALATDDPVFVNMTAAWCITCKINERVAINREATQTLFNQMNIHYIKGDWTSYDATITQYLEQFDRNGVPLYVYYPAKDNLGNRPAPIILPQILTVDTIKEYVVR